MWIFFKLAWRNILRFKRRSFITFISSSLGLALLILSLSFMNGIDRNSMENIINSQQSHLTLFAPGYFEKRSDMPLAPFISEPDGICEVFRTLPGVQAVEARIRFASTLISGADELPCMGIAVDPMHNPNLFNIRERLTEGQWLVDDDGILVGRNLAEDLGLVVGDAVTLRLIIPGESDQFSWNAMDVHIRGIFDSGNPAIDKGAIFIALKTAQIALSLQNRATEIALRLENADEGNLEDTKVLIGSTVRTLGFEAEVYSWKDLENTFLAISAMKTRNSFLIILVMLVISAVGIVNTMLMAVMERTREIGMMSAMGMKAREIMTLFILEGGLIGLMGAFWGCALGGSAAAYFQWQGLSFDVFGKTMTRMSEAIYPVKGVMYAELSVDTLLMVFFFGTAISLIAGTWPAVKAARLNPIQALRHI